MALTRTLNPHIRSLCVCPIVYYTLEVVDSYGDGICCGQYGDGNYTLTAGGEVLAVVTIGALTMGPPPTRLPKTACLEAPAIHDAPTLTRPTTTLGDVG